MSTTVDIEEGNRLIAIFMGFPEPTEFSLWDYDRSLDNSPFRMLMVKSVDGGWVSFFDKMAYERYGIHYFDGMVFRPYKMKQDDHAPCRPYSTDLNWLGKVVKAIYETEEGDEMESLTRKFAWWETEKTYRACVQFIQWYNKQKEQ